MKSCKIILMSLILFISLSLSACSQGGTEKKIEFGTNSANIKFNTKGDTGISFNVALFSDKKISDVSYIGIEGGDVSNNDFEVSIIDSGLDILDEYKYKGLFIKYIMVDITPKDSSVKSCEFNKLILNVDGQRRDVLFTTPVKHEFSGGNVFTEPLQISVIPNEFSSSMINDNTQIATYEFIANEDVTINSIYFTDFLKPADMTVAIGESAAQTASLPISVSKGQTIRIGMAFSSENATKETHLATNIFFEYTTDSDNAKHFNSAVVFFDPVYPIMDNSTENVDRLIDSINFE